MSGYWERYFADWDPSAWRAGVFVLVVLASWTVTGVLRLRGALRAADARKINHVLALAGVAVWFGWLPSGVARGSAIVTGAVLLMFVFLTCGLKDYRPFRWWFAANTRPSDAPHERLFFWSSWLVSMAALLLADLLFLDMRVTRTAALLVGLADGLAEPVGVRWGRRRYAVRWLPGTKPAVRSVEGSAVVALASFVIVMGCYWDTADGSLLLEGATLIAVLLMAVEAWSPHGWDNFTIPVAAALSLHFQFGVR